MFWVLFPFLIFHYVMQVCLSAEGAKNVSWPCLSSLRAWIYIHTSEKLPLIISKSFIHILLKATLERECWCLYYRGKRDMVGYINQEKNTTKIKALFAVHTHMQIYKYCIVIITACRNWTKKCVICSPLFDIKTKSKWWISNEPALYGEYRIT